MTISIERTLTSPITLIDPDDESVTVFYPQASPEVKEKEDLLPGLEDLKDWQLSATEMFAWLKL